MILLLKKSIGSKRAVVCLCAVLVAVSAFFYAPMDVKASETNDYEYSNSYTQNASLIHGPLHFVRVIRGFQFSSAFLNSLEDDVYYSIDLDYEFTLEFSDDSASYQTAYSYLANNINDNSILFFSPDGFTGTIKKWNGSNNFIAKGSDIKSGYLFRLHIMSGKKVDDLQLTSTLDYNILNCVPLTGVESASYQQGYNAGYSAGEQAGQDIGYSNGFEEGFEQGESQGYESGFEAGQDSVDTQSYYDAGYNAGYNAGYSLGYEEGYDEGYSKALKAVQGSSVAWGSPMFVGTPTEIKRYGQSFYVSSYGLLDMEEYQSGVNGYFYNTVPGTYDGYTTISYNIPFYSFNNRLVKIDSDKFQVDFGLRDLDISVECDDGNGTELANLFESRLNEVYLVYNGRKYYGNYDIGTGYVEFDFIAEGVGNPTYLNTGSMTLVFNIHNTVTLVTDADVSHFISAKYYNVLECSLGIPSNSYAIYIRPYLENDRVSANIQEQTDKITDSLDEQKEIQQGQLEEQQEQTETQKGIAASIREFFGSFFDNLINSIIHVIVPTKEEMGELFNRLNDFFSETFGFLYYPFEFIIDAFNIFLVADSGTGLTLPAFSIMGYEVWGNQTYDIASEPIVGEIFGFVRMGTGAMLVMWFVNFLKDFFDKRFGGGGN